MRSTAHRDPLAVGVLTVGSDGLLAPWAAGATQVCTSLIAVEPTVLNLGDVPVNRLKTADVVVRNLSDLPARIQLRSVCAHEARSHPWASTQAENAQEPRAPPC